MASTTPSPSRSRNTRAAGRASSRRSTSGCKAQRAVFGSKLGWERANWFARAGDDATTTTRFGRGNWFDAVGEEHRAVREAVGLFDQSSFAKYELERPGRRRGAVVDRANDVTRPPGRLTYTQMLNSRGGIECDLTVGAARRRPLLHRHRHRLPHPRPRLDPAEHPRRLDATLTDVTEDWGTLSLMGPRARDVLAAVTDADVSNAAFPFAHVREIAIAGVTCRALRVTYVGELGWELHIPIGETGDRLRRADRGRARRMGFASPATGRSSRSGSRRATAPGAPTSRPTTIPFQAGLGWAVKLKSGIPFLGRGAAEQAANRRLTKRLMTFTVDDPVGHAVRPRDHPPRRQGRRLSHQRRLRLHGRARTSASAMCATPTVSTTIISPPAATSWRSRRCACRRRSTWGRSTIRRMRG